MSDQLSLSMSRTDAVNNPVGTFDKLLSIQNIEDQTIGFQKSVKKLLLCCILAISGLHDIAFECADEEVEVKAKEVLDKNYSIQQRELTAICYMRLIADDYHQDWASNSPWRPKIIGFLDSVFQGDLYKDWKITSDKQSHEKIPLIQDAVNIQEKTLECALDALTSIDRITTQRQKLLSVINSRTGNVLTKQFLPSNIESLLSDTCDAITKYIDQRETPHIIDAYNHGVNTINALISCLLDHNTTYSLLIKEKLGDKLLDLIYEDFANNKAAQPAEVLLESKNKKYPINTIDTVIKLGVVVRNLGPGYAYDTCLEVVSSDKSLELSLDEIEIGRFPPNEAQMIEIPSRVLEISDSAILITCVKWKNYKGEEQSSDSIIEIVAQRKDIDWESLSQTDPYSLEPVETKEHLVGRKDVLNRLLASLKAENVGSSFIHGQKRVGKTSIAKVIRSQLSKIGYLILYLEVGDYITPSATATVSRLGTILCRMVSDNEPYALDIPIPTFVDALAPITDFLTTLLKKIPDRKIVIILDEFDKLPLELYERGAMGGSFFLTIKSITSRPHIGFILVGGEIMDRIIEYQGVELNKWADISVDYFSREVDWMDYKDLVQRPVSDSLEYTDEAINRLYELTEGNPYFTKLICQYIFRAALNNHDCFITRTEVDLAATRAISEVGKNTFQHFWEDRIFESGDKASEKSIIRRKILIGLSDTLKSESPASGKNLRKHPLLKDIPALESELKEFVTRKVLIGNIIGSFEEQSYDFKVQFFRMWLKDRGIQDVIATFSDMDAALKERQAEESLKIKPEEIIDLTRKWAIYKGQQISADHIRAWLEQFSSVYEQRSMFKMLQNLKYFSNLAIRQKMKEAHNMVIRGLGRSIGYRQQKRSDILISYLDAIGKSGASFTRLYADEAEIYVDNIVEKNKLLEEIKRREDVKAIVFLDDLVGTGHQAEANLKSLERDFRKIVVDRNIKLFFIAVAATRDGLECLGKAVQEMGIDIEIRSCELILETDKLFSDESSIYPDLGERENAKNIAYKYGKVLVKDNPLGYGSLGIAVVFEHRCPNDTLPILWAESSSPKWVPLFKRI